MKIEGYSKCECGAITFFTQTGNSYSCYMRNAKKFFPDIDLRKIKHYQRSYCCDHCVNHYGLDLCGCGSGENFGECTNDLESCKIPMQVVGKYSVVRDKNSWFLR